LCSTTSYIVHIFLENGFLYCMFLKLALSKGSTDSTFSALSMYSFYGPCNACFLYNFIGFKDQRLGPGKSNCVNFPVIVVRLSSLPARTCDNVNSRKSPGTKGKLLTRRGHYGWGPWGWCTHV